MMAGKGTCSVITNDSSTKRDWFSGKILRCHPSNVGEPWVRFPDHARLFLFDLLHESLQIYFCHSCCYFCFLLATVGSAADRFDGGIL